MQNKEANIDTKTWTLVYFKRIILSLPKMFHFNLIMKLVMHILWIISSHQKFFYVTNRISPHLDHQAKARSANSAKLCWILWLYAKGTKSRVQLVLVNIDEKYALSRGCDPRHNTTHHKVICINFLRLQPLTLLLKIMILKLVKNSIRLYFHHAGRMIQNKKKYCIVFRFLSIIVIITTFILFIDIIIFRLYYLLHHCCNSW